MAMAEKAEKLAMPPRIELVREAVARFDTAGLRSQLLKLDTSTLENLGLRLTDREISVRQTWEWLNKDLGGTADEPAIDDNAVYRFSDHFRRLYQQVRGEHARRIARLSVDEATASNVQSMHKVANARLIELVTERLVATDNLEELEAKEVMNLIVALDAHSKVELKREELLVKVAASERARLKLQSDLVKAQLERQQLHQKIQNLPAQVKALQKQIDRLEKQAQRGKSIDPRVFTTIREQLLGLAPAEVQS
jgi:hypothetical protein